MPSTTFNGVIEEIRAGKDVEKSLADIFSRTEKHMSRAERLQFTLRVLQEVTFLNSRNAHNAFLLAIKSLRGLLPHLKTKGESVLTTKTSIEARAVNHAATIILANRPVDDDLRLSAAALVEESLGIIFSAIRGTPNAKPSNKSGRRRERGALSAAKENSNPQLPVDTPPSFCEAALDDIAFHGASELGLQQCLPNHDAMTEAKVVTRALAVKLTAMSCSAPLSDLYMCAKMLIMPWVRYCREPTDNSEKHYQRNVKAVQSVLFDSAEAQTKDPVTALRVRAYALTLKEPSLKTYARELLRCAHCLTRSNGNHRQNVFDVVGSVYDEALQFVAKFDGGDPNWFAEDVSAWMDHVALVWSKRTKWRPLPMIFERRIISLRNGKEKNGLLEVSKLQLHLVEKGLYSYHCEAAAHSNGAVFNEEAFEDIEKPLSQLKVPSLSSLSKSGGKSKSRRPTFRTLERIGLHRLRILRVLEPLGRSILAFASNSPQLPCGATMVLEVFLAATTSGLFETAGDHSKLSPEELKKIADIQAQVYRMVGLAFEAAAGLSRVHFRAHREEDLLLLVRVVGVLLNTYFKSSQENAAKRRRWLCQVFRTDLRNLLTRARNLPQIDRLDAISTVAAVADECERTWFADQIGNESFQRTRFELLDIVRSCFILLKDWTNVAEISLRKLTHAVKVQNGVPEKAEDEFLVSCHDFAKDIARVFDDGDSPAISLDSECLVDFLLAVIMDYSGHITSQLSLGSSRDHENHQALRNLAKARAFLLEEIENNSQKGLCPQRELHQMWLALCLQGTNQETKVDGPGLPDRKADRAALTCSHCTGGIRSFHEEATPCSEDHLAYTDLLYNILNGTLKGDMDEVRVSVKKAKFTLSESKRLSGDIELMTLSFEIFRCVQHVAALKDIYDVSTEALSASRLCNLQFHDSESHTTVGSFCSYLANLGSQKNVWTVPDASWNRASNLSTNPQRGYAPCSGTEHVRTQPAGVHGLIAELKAANQDLKDSLTPLMSHRPLKQTRMTSISCQIAGVDVDVAYDVLIHVGQNRIHDLLFLMASLYRNARLLLLVENIADGKYYLERCMHVASLCLPPENTFLRTLSRVVPLAYQTDRLIEGSSKSSNAQSMQEVIPEGKDPRVVFIMRQAVANAVLDKCSNRCTHLVDDDAGTEILQEFQACERIMDQMDEEDYLLSASELSLSRGLALSCRGKYAEAMKHLRVFNHEDFTAPKILRGIGLYFYAKALVCNGFNAATDSNISTRSTERTSKRNTSKRNTRRKSRSTRGENESPDLEARDVSDMLKRCLEETGNSLCCPRLNRRVWSLNGFSATNTQESVAALRKAIGCTFDIRWSVARHGKEACSQRRSREFLPAGNTWNSFKDEFLDDKDCVPSSFPESLRKAKCVVLGLNLDDARENLQVWRLSPNGVVSKRLPLPATSRTSFAGITDRMADVFLEMKRMLVKPGDSFSTEEKIAWWEHRHQLDDEIRQVVTDIEGQWLREFKGLLLPFIFGESFLEEINIDEEDAAGLSELAMSTSKRQDGESSESESKGQSKSRRSRKKQGMRDVATGTLCLVVDTVLERIPWESLPVLREAGVSACRVPSLSYLDYHLQQKAVTVGREDVLFVVNPGGDLRRTENTFKAHRAFESWTGFYGKTSKGEVWEAYKNQSVYLYCGHGAGDQYIPPRKFCKRGKAPIALLMGCSSARASNFKMGDCESNGAWVDYLVQDSPAVVGNLWDVGDQDIDRLTSAVLLNWLGLDESGKRHSCSKSLAEAVAVSRSVCRLPYLVGAACVVIGVPNIRAK